MGTRVCAVAGAVMRFISTELLTRFPETEGLYVGPDRVLHCTTGLAPCFQPYSEV